MRAVLQLDLLQCHQCHLVILLKVALFSSFPYVLNYAYTLCLLPNLIVAFMFPHFPAVLSTLQVS
jgi:hypothetical protein